MESSQGSHPQDPIRRFPQTPPPARPAESSPVDASKSVSGRMPTPQADNRGDVQPLPPASNITAPVKKLTPKERLESIQRINDGRIKIVESKMRLYTKRAEAGLATPGQEELLHILGEGLRELHLNKESILSVFEGLNFWDAEQVFNLGQQYLEQSRSIYNQLIADEQRLNPKGQSTEIVATASKVAAPRPLPTPPTEAPARVSVLKPGEVSAHEITDMIGKAKLFLGNTRKETNRDLLENNTEAQKALAAIERAFNQGRTNPSAESLTPAEAKKRIYKLIAQYKVNDFLIKLGIRESHFKAEQKPIAAGLHARAQELARQLKAADVDSEQIDKQVIDLYSEMEQKLPSEYTTPTRRDRLMTTQTYLPSQPRKTTSAPLTTQAIAVREAKPIERAVPITLEKQESKGGLWDILLWPAKKAAELFSRYIFPRTSQEQTSAVTNPSFVPQSAVEPHARSLTEAVTLMSQQTGTPGKAFRSEEEIFQEILNGVDTGTQMPVRMIGERSKLEDFVVSASWFFVKGGKYDEEAHVNFFNRVLDAFNEASPEQKVNLLLFYVEMFENKAFLPPFTEGMWRKIGEIIGQTQERGSAEIRKIKVLGEKLANLVREPMLNPIKPFTGQGSSFDLLLRTVILPKTSVFSLGTSSAYKKAVGDVTDDLTLKLVGLISEVDPFEYTDTNWLKSNKRELSPNILKVIANFNNVNNYVQNQILSLETPKERAKLIQFWIDVAKKALKNNNYDLFLCVCVTLESTAIRRLSKSWAEVDSSRRDLFESFKKILEMKNNRYVELEKMYPKKGDNTFYIPYQGQVLTHLNFSKEMGSTVAEGKFNLGKAKMIAPMLTDMQRLKKIYVDSYGYEERKMKTDVCDQIDGVILTEETFYHRSKTLEPQTTNEPKQKKRKTTES